MSSATGVCARCGAPLQPQALFCSQCGLSLVAPQVASTQVTGPGAFAIPIESTPQPGYIASPGPASQPGSVLQPGYGLPKQRFPRKGCLYPLIASFLVACLLGGVLWFAYLSPNHVQSPFFDRHGLPATIPLPDNVTFNFARDISASLGGIFNLFTTPTLFHQSVWLDQEQKAASAFQFYLKALPSRGWEDIHQSSDGAGGQALIGCQGNQVLTVDFSDSQRQLRDTQGNIVDTVTPPPGGSILQFTYGTVNNSFLLSEACGT